MYTLLANIVVVFHLFFIAFALFGGAIARGLSADVEVARVAGRVLLVAAVFQTMDAITMVLRGVLRAAKDVRVVAIVGVAIAWLCVPTSAYLLGKVLGLGAIGGWVGFVAETTLSAVIFWRRWTHGGWRSAYAPPARPAPVPDALATPALPRQRESPR